MHVDQPHECLDHSMQYKHVSGVMTEARAHQGCIPALVGLVDGAPCADDVGSVLRIALFS